MPLRETSLPETSPPAHRFRGDSDDGGIGLMPNSRGASGIFAANRPFPRALPTASVPTASVHSPINRRKRKGATTRREENRPFLFRLLRCVPTGPNGVRYHRSHDASAGSNGSDIGEFLDTSAGLNGPYVNRFQAYRLGWVGSYIDKLHQHTAGANGVMYRQVPQRAGLAGWGHTSTNSSAHRRAERGHVSAGSTTHRFRWVGSYIDKLVSMPPGRTGQISASPSAHRPDRARRHS